MCVCLHKWDIFWFIGAYGSEVVRLVVLSYLSSIPGHGKNYECPGHAMKYGTLLFNNITTISNKYIVLL